MINKTLKLINNKFSRYFKFVFFLRYLFVIFFVALVIFLSIPHFFDYKKKEIFIKNYLLKNYSLNIQTIENIKFRSFPLPNLTISSIVSNYYSDDNNLKIQELIIYPELFSIYNYSNFQSRKIKLKNNDLKINFKDIKVIKSIFNLERKIIFKDLNLKITDDDNNKIIFIKKINFSNFGYKKNNIEGELFDRRFKIDLNNDFSNLNFKLLDTGLSTTLDILEKNKEGSFKGVLKGKVIKSNFYLNFIYEPQSIKVNNFFFRDKKFSFDSDGVIKFKPFFHANTSSKIKSINKELLKNINISDFLKFKQFIKIANSENNFVYKTQRFSNNFFDVLNIKTNLAHGKLNISKIFLISKGKITCNSNVDLMEEYPIIYFHCSIYTVDKKNLLKKIKINYKIDNEPLFLDINGNLNILNNKINFETIKMNKDFKANEQDLKFLKTSFENILFNESFIKIFELSKIKKFILEIL